MILDNINELTLYGAFERGMPNREHIAICVNSSTNMAQYGLMLGVAQNNNAGIPIKDNFFWFGEGEVKNGDWIFIFTGQGKPTTILSSNKVNSIYTLYWNRTHTLLHNSTVVPMLYRMDAIQILPGSVALPQS